jgi:glycosyltransferase involved in cell wall biosynthesis
MKDEASSEIDVLFVILDVEFMLENAPVLQTQVGEQMLALARQGIRCALLATYKDRERFDGVIGQRLRAARIEIALIEHRGRLSNLLRLAATLRGMRRGIRRLYARGIWGPVVLLLSGRVSEIPYVYDVRGALVDETIAARSAKWKAWLFAAIERWCIRRAYRVSAVSTPLASDVAARFGRADIVVIPSCVRLSATNATPDSIRDIRANLGLHPSAIVLVYSGGLDYYQQVPEMLELWWHLLSEADLRFLLLTNEAPRRDTDGALNRLSEFGDRLVRRTVAREEVGAHLAAADVGFMLREQRFLNKAASPVKFAEYLAAGLGVVASPGTGDVSDLITTHDLGTLVDPRDAATGASRVRDWLAVHRANRSEVRSRARRLAATRYDWDAYAPVFAEFYGPGNRHGAL